MPCIKFDNLENKKQRQILNAAYKEFTAKGYKNASTNEIVKKAEISKGTLFYYFDSKKELYHYLIEYGIEFIKTDFLDEIDENQTDFIEKCRAKSQAKMKAYNKNPHIFNFFGTLYLNKEKKMIPADLKEKMDKLKELSYTKLFENIDTSLFRKDIPSNMIIKLINWSLEGYEKELMAELKNKDLSAVDFGPYWDDFHEFLEILKKLYYK